MLNKRAGWLFTLSAVLAWVPGSLFANGGIDERIDDAVRPFADAVSGFIFSSFPVGGVPVPFVLVWLLLAATAFTVYFRFINFRAFRHGFQLVDQLVDHIEATLPELRLADVNASFLQNTCGSI